MKICCTCKSEKSLDLFGNNRNSPDGHDKRCLECSRIAASKYYHKHTATAKFRVKRNIAKLREWYKDLKRTLKCIKCGENHPACLEFHHRDPGQKDMAVSKMFLFGSKIKVLEEIEKCDVLCANCHRKLHNP